MTKDKKITVIISGGGTGGHIYPAIAVIQKLKTDDQIEKIYYIGCPYNMEKDIAAKEEVEFLPIKVSGLPRKTGFGLIKWFFELSNATANSISYLMKIKPDVVLGTGGYVSGPVLIAATILRIPFVIHDSDAYPGIVNRFMAPWAKAVTVAFEQAKEYLKSGNVIVNGNPIRSFDSITKQEALSFLNLDPEKKTILVVGGSQGAKTINDAMLNAAQILVNEYNFQIIHQTGKKNFEEYKEKIAEKWPEYSKTPAYMIKPYFDNMGYPLAAADLAISRSGSLSISELNLSGLPSILVPYPYAAADHQRFNAKAMIKAGASAYLEDSDCNSENLVKLILDIFNDKNRLNDMKEANKRLAKPDSTANLIEILKKSI